MALFRSERGIGRGEVAESRLEVPIFAGIMLACLAGLFIQHVYVGNQSVTLAIAVSMVVFGITVARVDFGVYILILAMLLSPEIETENAYTGRRAFSIRYDDILIMVIFVGVMVKLTFEGRLAPWQPSPINAGIMSYYGICLFSSLLALERGLGAWDPWFALFTLVKMLEYYLIFFLVGHAVRSRADLRHMLVLSFVVALIVSAYGIYSIGTTPRVSAPFEKGGTEPNTLGGYLVLIICIALGLATQARNWMHSLPLVGAALICAVPLLYTLSRASYIALIAGLLVLSAVSRKFVIAAAIALCVLSAPLTMPAPVLERVAYTFQEEGGEQIAGTNITVDKSTHERVLVWRKVGYILGVGLEYALIGGGVAWESVLDSQYARIILETGLVGLAAFLFLQFTLLRTARDAYRWTPDWVGRGLAMGFFAATIALIVHSTGTISFLIARIMGPYWLFAALCVFVRNDALRWHEHRRASHAARAAAPKQEPEEAQNLRDQRILSTSTVPRRPAAT